MSDIAANGKEQNRFWSAWGRRLVLVGIILVFLFVYSWVTGTLTIERVPLLLGIVGVIFLMGTGSVRGMLGEFGDRERSTFNRLFSLIFVIALFVPIAFFAINSIDALIKSFNPASFKWETLLMLTPGPFLLTIVRQLPLKKDNELNNRILLSASKKIALSSICLISFFPIMLIVNITGVDPLAADNSNLLYWISGTTFFWLAAFLFYSGIILVLAAVGDMFDLLERGT